MDALKFLDVVESCYGKRYESVKAFASQSEVHNKLKVSPSSVDHRYFTEDIPYVLVPWLSFAKVAGVSAPIMEAVINMGSLIKGEDFEKNGRNIEAMGLDRILSLMAVKGDEACIA